jgi:hypothetical protein
MWQNMVEPDGQQITTQYEILSFSCRITKLIIQTHTQIMYVVGSKSFRPDTQKPRRMGNAVRDI